MNPFLRSWPKLYEHRPDGDGCTPGPGNVNYVELSNSPKLPTEADMAGCVVVIAGKARTGKSVISHTLIHELVNDTRHLIDLADFIELDEAQNNEEAGPWFTTIVDMAYDQHLLSPEAVQWIHAGGNGGIKIRRLNRALEGKGLIIRTPWPQEPYLTPVAHAHIISNCARSAERLDGSVYLYEYRYPSTDEWKNLCRSLQYSNVDNVSYVETPLLLVDDAMKFIEKRLRGHRLNREVMEWDDTEDYLNEKAVESNGGLESGLSDLNRAMYRAFSASAQAGEGRVPVKRIIAAYEWIEGYRTNSDGAA